MMVSTGDAHALRQGLPGILQHNIETLGTRASRDNEVACEEKLSGAVPVRDAQKRVCADQTKEVVLRREAFFQVENGVDGVVRMTIRSWRIESRYLETRVFSDCQTHHGDTIFKAGDGGILLQRLFPHWRKQDLIQTQAVGCCSRDGE